MAEGRHRILEKSDMIIGGILTFIIFIVFYKTMAVNVSFWDAGEYIACSNALAVPHPPGNPLYIFLGRFFALLPLPMSQAAKINFISVLCSTFGATFMYLLTVRLMRTWQNTKDSFFIHFAGIVAALLTAFSKTYWDNTIEAEVYAPLAFLVILCSWLIAVWNDIQKDFDHQGILVLVAYILWLGFGIHQTVFQILPAIALYVTYPLINWRSKRFWQWFGIHVVIAMVLFVLFNKVGVHEGQYEDAESGNGKYVLVFYTLAVMIYYLRDYFDKKFWYAMGIVMVIGLATHLYLPIRAALDPYINEGDPSTWENFKAYLGREQYGRTTFLTRNVTDSVIQNSFFYKIGMKYLAQLWYQFDRRFLYYFGWQYMNWSKVSSLIGMPVAAMKYVYHLLIAGFGTFGLYKSYQGNKKSFVYIAALIFWASFGMVFVMNLKWNEVRERDYFFVPAYFFVSMIAAIGVGEFLKIVWQKYNKILVYALALIIMIFPVTTAYSWYYEHDRSDFYIAHDYGANLLNSCEPNAIIFTNGDNDTFPLWYCQTVEGIRNDVTVANLSLLNTPWYVNQMKNYSKIAKQYKEDFGYLEGLRPDITNKNKEGALSYYNSMGIEFDRGAIKIQPEKYQDIEFRWSDAKIQQLYPRRRSNNEYLRVIRNGREVITADLNKGKVPGRLQSKYGNVVMVNEQSVREIIEANYGKRPIYFAVTCEWIYNLEPYLEQHGMVYKLTENRAVSDDGEPRVNAEMCEFYLDNVFSYKGLFDDDIFKDANTIKLINNYANAYIKLGAEKLMQGDIDGGEKNIDYAIKLTGGTWRSRYQRLIYSNYLKSFQNFREDVDVFIGNLNKKRNDNIKLTDKQLGGALQAIGNQLQKKNVYQKSKYLAEQLSTVPFMKKVGNEMLLDYYSNLKLHKEGDELALQMQEDYPTDKKMPTYVNYFKNKMEINAQIEQEQEIVE